MNFKDLTKEQKEDLLLFTASSGATLPLESVEILFPDRVILKSGAKKKLANSSDYEALKEKLALYEEFKFYSTKETLDKKIKQLTKKDVEEHTEALKAELARVQEEFKNILKTNLSLIKTATDEVMSQAKQVTDLSSKLNTLSKTNVIKTVEDVVEETRQLHKPLADTISLLKECVNV